MEKEFLKNFIENLEKELPNDPEFVKELAELIEGNNFTKTTYSNLIEELGGLDDL